MELNYRLPLEYESKWSDDSSGKGMAIDNKHIVAHPPIEGDLGDDVHPGVAKLEGDHGDVGLAFLDEVLEGSLAFHFWFVISPEISLGQG